MKFKLHKLKLTFRCHTIEGNKVVAWNVWRDRKHIAGGMCDNKADARKDGNLWMRDNLQFGDRVILRRQGLEPVEVRIESPLAETQGTCFYGEIIFRDLYRRGRKLKLSPIRHRAWPRELHLPE